MPKFRLNPDHPAVDLFRPAGDLDSIRVEPGQEIDVPGDLAPDAPEDGYLVDNGGELRLWPKALWELVEAPAPKSKSKPAAQAEPPKES